MTLWLHMTAGRGPAECCVAVAGVVSRLLEEAKREGLRVDVIEACAGPVPSSLSSALLSLEGEGAERFASSWEGTVCWNAKSPLRPGHKRKNWFIGVSVLAPPREDTDFELRDVEMSALRAGGPGGQHVNKTASAVRVVHRPSGLSTVAREERSQHRNRALALARLRALLDEKKRIGDRESERDRWRRHDGLERGSAVRTFEGARFSSRPPRSGSG